MLDVYHHDRIPDRSGWWVNATCYDGVYGALLGYRSNIGDAACFIPESKLTHCVEQAIQYDPSLAEMLQFAQERIASLKRSSAEK